MIVFGGGVNHSASNGTLLVNQVVGKGDSHCDQ